MVDDRPKRKKSVNQEVPTMPEGFYSGDQPNPNLRAFVEEHLKERPYDPEHDDYEVIAFNEPINTTKATAIYNMHTYWSKKPHDAIRQYIQHYTKEGDLVLDPFCGSGGTALAALLEGRKAIAIDRSPAATFITKNYCTPVNVEELQKAFEDLKTKVKPEIDWLYETQCDRCGGKATTAYTVYSQVFQCPRCMEKVPLFDCVETKGQTKAGKPKKIMVCPYCYENNNIEEINTRSKKFGSIPVLVSYICENGCKSKRGDRMHNDPNPKKRGYFEKYDLAKIREIDENEIPYWYPPHKMMNVEDDSKPWGVKWRAGTSNFRTVGELFTKRNLWALAVIKDAALTQKYSDFFLFALTAVSLALSKMQRYSPNSGFPNMVLMGTYYMPQIGREIEVLNWYTGKIKSLIKGYESLCLQLHDVIISCSDSRSMGIPSNSIDYIFTDPPYADNTQYGELNFIWEAWLDFDTHWHDDEIIVNEVRGKIEADWANMMHQAMFECYRVLKPGRWLSLCYHDTSEGTWAIIQDIMAEVGFIVDKSDSALFIDTGQKSYNQLTADKVNKRDLVINFQKPKPDEITLQIAINGDEDKSTFNEKVHILIRDYIEAYPGSTKDRIYDELVSRMVRSGKMEAHNFDELLSQVAEPIATAVAGEEKKWFLRESAMAIVDAAESAKEDNASEDIRSFIMDLLKKDSEREGIHYSDIFEHYLYAVKDKPRRPLAEWLLDYFYKTNEGTYRLPITKEEELVKKEGRVKGINRRIKRYIAFLEQEVSIHEENRPSAATLADWIHHCRRSGMYDQGKLLYERGGITFDNLTDEQQVDVEENYQACIRAIDRFGSSSEKKKGRKSKK